jgi:hypothetical protein
MEEEVVYQSLEKQGKMKRWKEEKTTTGKKEQWEEGNITASPVSLFPFPVPDILIIPSLHLSFFPFFVSSL